MRDYLYDIYLAGPFFNAQQKEVMRQVKVMFTDLGLKVCDPQDLSPVIVDLPPEERDQHLDAIFENNILGMMQSWAIVACIDERDTGTSFELGYFKAMSDFAREGEPEPLRITFSAHGYGCNVMLAKSVHAHFANIGQFVEQSRRVVQYIKDRTDGSVIKDSGWLRGQAEATE